MPTTLLELIGQAVLAAVEDSAVEAGVAVGPELAAVVSQVADGREVEVGGALRDQLCRGGGKKAEPENENSE